jgi:hypothetical protein
MRSVRACFKRAVQVKLFYHMLYQNGSRSMKLFIQRKKNSFTIEAKLCQTGHTLVILDEFLARCCRIFLKINYYIHNIYYMVFSQLCMHTYEFDLHVFYCIRSSKKLLS